MKDLQAIIDIAHQVSRKEKPEKIAVDEVCACMITKGKPV
jgi:hypothetical protein